MNDISNYRENIYLNNGLDHLCIQNESVHHGFMIRVMSAAKNFFLIKKIMFGVNNHEVSINIRGIK